MSKNKNKVSPGRPEVSIDLPSRKTEFVLNDVMACNTVCRLTASRKLAEMSKGAKATVYRAKFTRETGGVGKPMAVYFHRSNITPEVQASIDEREAQAAIERRSRAALKAAKARKANASKGKAKAHKRTRKLATVPAIVMTPATVTVNVDPIDIVSVPVTPAPEPAPVDLTADRSAVLPDVPAEPAIA